MRGARTRVRAIVGLSEMAEAQRGTLLLWMPVALGVGIAVFFSLKFEPDFNHYLALGGATTTAIAALWVAPTHMRPPLIAVVLVVIGFLNAGWSAHRNKAPVLGFHYYGAVEGRIIAVDRSARNMPRITLDRVILRRVSPRKTPKNVRISLHYPKQYFPLDPGRHVMLTARLSPPSGPVEPGGFDFQRYAWFRTLGAVGFSKTPVLQAGPVDRAGFAMWLASLRVTLSALVQDRIAGQTGAFAAAILTGDRSAITPHMVQVLRNSNLAHLLAISGFHMGLLTGFVFASLRLGLALVPFLALRLPVKKLAAVAAFAAAIAYLGISGANVATQRAFVMAAVMLVAVLLDRRTITMRVVAVAAVIVLAFRPESLIEAGFQMSFSATTALVAVFGVLRDRGWLIGGRGGLAQPCAVRFGAGAVIRGGRVSDRADFGLSLQSDCAIWSVGKPCVSAGDGHACYALGSDCCFVGTPEHCTAFLGHDGGRDRLDPVCCRKSGCIGGISCSYCQTCGDCSGFDCLRNSGCDSVAILPKMAWGAAGDCGLFSLGANQPPGFVDFRKWQADWRADGTGAVAQS